jgi:hypothetical protein
MFNARTADAACRSGVEGMKADQFGAPESLSVDDVPTPDPGPDEARHSAKFVLTVA